MSGRRTEALLAAALVAAPGAAGEPALARWSFDETEGLDVLSIVHLGLAEERERTEEVHRSLGRVLGLLSRSPGT